MKIAIIFTILVTVSHPLFSQKYGVVPVGNVSVDHMEQVRNAISEFYNLDVAVLNRIPIQDNFKTNIDTIYNAAEINRYMDSIWAGVDKIVAVTNRPITIIDFLPSTMATKMLVRGYANQVGGDCATISTYKIKLEATDKTEFKFLLKKLSIHEFGHLLELDHCENESCLMVNGFKFSKEIPILLCGSCRKKLPFLSK